ncbi:BTAD domain-containing putative transcriptional regulator [Streptomyces sp. NPDC048604]|uniref:AfsR/SARP family transcriptional regulator n=1 Tax=Streptomyces sp. NPDC048604 TaxID=3365578 RepID=UPI003714C3DA
MRYSVLGPTQVHAADGTPVPVGGPRLRALLTALALRAGRVVPVGALVAEVWDAGPPADEVAALQALVGRLRRALGHGAVASAEGGYRLVAAPDDVDLFRFDRLVGEGVREAAAGGDPQRAGRLLDEALGLWRGPVLADLPDRTVQAARWEARSRTARRARAEAAVARGDAEPALAELAALTAEHPLDEPLQALRLRALRAAGRPAEALEGYESVRRLLADGLGTDPGPELRALHAELLSPSEPHRPAAAPETPGAPTPHAAPTPSAAPPPPAAPAPAPPAPRPVGNLRARLTSFVGREDDIARLRTDLGQARLITLLGAGGAGKTSLAVQAARAESRTGAWDDGVWVAELAPVTDPDAVVEAALGALGARETVVRAALPEELRSTDPLGLLLEHCADLRLLLVLDNCEHLVAAAAALAETLLAHCPDVTILATSREPLGVPGEVVRPVEPLPEATALRLFAERGATVRPGFAVDEDPEAAAEICRRLDGLPLAVELAAARLRLLTPRQIADRLDDRFRLLTTGARTVLPRQQTLRAVVDWSWDLLTDPECLVLRRLSVFSGGCDLAAAEAVCTTASATPATPATLDLLGALVDKSLVVAAPDPVTGAMRYRLLETVAEYGAERLDEAGDRGDAERRHLVHYRELARAADPELRGPGQAPALARIRAEYENLRTALRRAVAARDEDEALMLVHTLLWYWQMRDLRADARHWAGAAAELGPDPFAAPAAPVVPLDAPVTAAPPPLDEARRWEARRGVRLVELLNMNHDTARWTSPEGLHRLNEIVAVYPPGLPQTCRLPGAFALVAVLLTGDQARTRHALDVTVSACREHGFEWELANALQLRANILANRADWAGEAVVDADEALKLFLRLGDSWGVAEALSSRGEARERRLEFAGAAEDFAAAVGHAERLGAQSQTALLRARHACMLVETDRRAEGEEILRQIVDGEHGRGLEAVVVARSYLGVLLGRTGRTAEARAHFQALIGEFNSETFAIFEGFTLGGLGWLDNVDGAYDSAFTLVHQAYHRSLGGLSLMVAPQMPAAHLVNAAWALAGLGGSCAPFAAPLLGAAAALGPGGYLLAPQEQENLAVATALARERLGEAAFEARYAEGGGLSLAEAAALLDRADAIRRSAAES